MIGNDCGLIVPVSDQISMTEAIKACLLDSEKREFMGRNALGISQRYNKDKIVCMWQNAINNVIAKGRDSNE